MLGKSLANKTGVINVFDKFWSRAGDKICRTGEKLPDKVGDSNPKAGKRTTGYRKKVISNIAGSFLSFFLNKFKSWGL